MTPYQQAAVAVLRMFGRELDAAANAGADACELDQILTAMRVVHLGIHQHLTAPPTLASKPATTEPAALRVRELRQRAAAARPAAVLRAVRPPGPGPMPPRIGVR
ncbi:hypothetical protein [Kitasatospora sp. LaBMicrA B282]|uniref:hypothetical protein n=1 Tax=Kitasatospora sp. LaBMicrA B282 TaxID=3420949 RepID=UPI003D12087A